MSAYLTQARTEMRLTLRQGEQLLASLGIPILLLVFFSIVDVLPTDGQTAVDFLTPGIITLAVMGNAMVSLGIGTGFERHYLVLKRLGATPLGRPRLIAAKITNVVAIDIVQVGLIMGVAFALSWDPSWTVHYVVLGVVFGTAAFGGIGLALAGKLSGLVNLAVANALYIVLLLIGGTVFPLDELPGALEQIARALPAAAMSEIVRAGTAGASLPAAEMGVLLLWALAAPSVAVATFKWE